MILSRKTSLLGRELATSATSRDLLANLTAHQREVTMGKEFFIFYGGSVLSVPIRDYHCIALFGFHTWDKLPKTRRKNALLWLMKHLYLVPLWTIAFLLLWSLIILKPYLRG
jgi:hypothetical protein